MKMDFETIWKNTLEKIVNEYQELRQTHREMSFSGLINGHLIINPFKNDFDRYLEIVGMYDENNKVQFRAWPFEKIGRALIFTDKANALAMAEVLKLQYPGREFTVCEYRATLENRIKKLAEIANLMVE